MLLFTTAHLEVCTNKISFQIGSNYPNRNKSGNINNILQRQKLLFSVIFNYIGLVNGAGPQFRDKRNAVRLLDFLNFFLSP